MTKLFKRVAAGRKAALRVRLERTLVRDRDLGRQIADEWLAVDREMWRRLGDKHSIAPLCGPAVYP